jgi:putative salt-induced outer membrane protein YdiY
MIFQLRRPQRFSLPIFLGLALILAGIMSGPLQAEEVILLMKSGDLVSGRIISESTNQVVISNSWAKVLSVPLTEIAKRQSVTNISAPAPAMVAKPGTTPAVTVAKLAAGKPSVAKPATPKGKWHGQINVGLDALFSTSTQQDYFGKFRLTYEQAYKSNPKKFYRNTTEVGGDYQKTDGKISSNRGNASNKSDFDIGDKSYGYVSGGGGFDEIQKISSQYQAGFGIGRHVIHNDGFVLDLESGLDYQAEYRTDETTSQSVYGRLAEDLTWHIRKNLTFTQKLEFYQDLERTSQYHGDFNSNFSYGFWENLTLNLMADESYNTDVAPGVQRNTFELRLTLGVTF